MLKRSLLAASFLICCVSIVSAYTVVMRDGRRVEIPNDFAVTNSTLTYDVSNGIQITIQLNTVDISATERLNGETPGALMRKAAEPQPPVEPVPQTRPNAERTITNADLEKYRNARVESENQRKELGLPSIEDRQLETAAIEDRTLEQVRTMRAQEEAYWRSRAEAFRAQAAATEAQMGTSRQAFDQTPPSYSFGGFPAFGPFETAGFGITGGRFNRFRGFSPSPFDGFLATPITPFPSFRNQGRRPIFTVPRVRMNPRPVNRGHGSRR